MSILHKTKEGLIYYKNDSGDYIIPKYMYMFYFKCHIVFMKYLVISYLLSANKADHDGTSHERFSEM